MSEDASVVYNVSQQFNSLSVYSILFGDSLVHSASKNHQKRSDFFYKRRQNLLQSGMSIIFGI